MRLSLMSASIVLSLVTVQNLSELNSHVQATELPILPTNTIASAKQCMPLTQSSLVSGVVTYRQRIALPPNAIVEVQLLDVSQVDAPAIVLAEQTILTRGKQVPIPFALLYDPEKIQPDNSYAVQARILIAGKLRWINTSRCGVMTQDNPTTVEVMVDPVR